MANTLETGARKFALQTIFGMKSLKQPNFLGSLLRQTTAYRNPIGNATNRNACPDGIKIKGQDLRTIEAFGLQLEQLLKTAEGVKTSSVFADRIVGKPYLLLDIDREQLARYGITVEKVQQTIAIAVGGMPLTQTVEGRERYTIQVRYPRALRDTPEDLKTIYIPVSKGQPVPLSELVNIRYEQGPQVIKSEDTFLVGYVLFDKLEGFAEVNVVENAQAVIQANINSGALSVPKGINYAFTGTYENQLRAEKHCP